MLSPVLFAVYSDELLGELQSLGLGCSLGGVYAGALAYADDTTLLAPSFFAMRKMLEVCEKFAQQYDVLFNSTKSISIVFNCPTVNNIPPFKLHGVEIPRENNAVHLGTWIGSNACEKNVTKACCDLYTSTNKIKKTFPRATLTVKTEIFRTHCSSY